jgi:hypothetical protein
MPRGLAHKLLAVLLAPLVIHFIFFIIPAIAEQVQTNVAEMAQWAYGWLLPFTIAGEPIGFWIGWFVVFLLMGFFGQSLSWVPELMLILTLGLITFGPATEVYWGGPRAVWDREIRHVGRAIAFGIAGILSLVVLIQLIPFALGFPGMVVAVIAHIVGSSIQNVKGIKVPKTKGGRAVIAFLLLPPLIRALYEKLGEFSVQPHLNAEVAQFLALMVPAVFIVGVGYGLFMFVTSVMKKAKIEQPTVAAVLAIAFVFGLAMLGRMG